MQYKDIAFAKFGIVNELEKLNKVEVPLFMRWGNVNEMILQDADKLSEIVNEIVKNGKKDIFYIDGADHGYTDKEDVVAKEISNFLRINNG